VAFLIPENLRNNSALPPGHRRVVTALAVGLEEQVTVWYEPPFDRDGERPDFVVLDPALGVVVVAVFDQHPDQDVLGAVRGELRVAADGTERVVPDPLARADRFGKELQDLIAANAQVDRAVVSGVAAFPYVSRDRGHDLGLDTIVAMEHCLFKDDLDEIIKGDDDSRLFQLLNRALEGGVGEPLTDDDLKVLRGLIHPEVVIAAAPEQPSLFVDRVDTRADLFRVMDRKQERFAKGLGSGHRIIRGVAGSGKTLILVARARLLSKLLPGEQVLVTCYTKALASVLRSQLSDCDNVVVEHVDSLMAKAIKAAGLEHPGFRSKVEVSSVAVQAIELRPQEQFRAVLVDEAQDLDTDVMRFIVSLARPGEDDMGDLLIVADSAQNIFRRKFSWSDAGIKAQGRTSILRRNYRNTQEILAFAQRFLTAGGSVEFDDAPEVGDDVSIIPAEAAERSGPEPTAKVVDSTEQEIAAVVSEVASRYWPSLPARSIAVLMVNHSGDDRGRRIVEGLRAKDLPVYWVTDPSQPSNKDNAGVVDEPIIVSTVHSAKGLEFPSVVLCGLGGSMSEGADNTGVRKAIYVGMTRALDDLVVITTADNIFAADLTPDDPDASD
jgi:hypothetical protein